MASSEWRAARTLSEIGVRRVTIGASFARAALGAMLRAAHEVFEHGTFGYLDETPSLAEINRLFDAG